MSEYTPGPWKASLPKGSSGWWDVGNGEDSIATLYGPDEAIAANARLIAAAPEMLEALENIENDDAHMPAAIWDLIQKAIAKAKGGE